MPVTITGGVSFTGNGVTMVGAPTVATAGWNGGGNFGATLYTTVDRITFATDTATASVRGPLSVGRRSHASSGTLTYGWFGGGYVGAPTYSATSVDRITYATDTATASARGPLSAGRYRLASTSDGSTYSWFGGGQPQQATVDRITYATDTATAVARGPLSVARMGLSGAGNTSYGWYIAGWPPVTSLVDRITYANDTATATARGPVSAARYFAGATSDNSSYGWFAGGISPGSIYYTTVDRITYANDTVTASVRGPLLDYRTNMSSTGSSTFGWFGAGGIGNPSVAASSVTRITYATDTATSVNKGPLSSVRVQLSGASGLQ